MRLYLKVTENKQVIPFNYQPLLTGVIHKWIGKANLEHSETSLYSFSWLRETSSNKLGIVISDNSYWFISAHNVDLMKKIVTGIQNDPNMFYGISVKEISIKDTPIFSNKERFNVANPVFIKKVVENNIKFLFYDQDGADELLTKSLRSKCKAADLTPEGLHVTFDKEYPNPKIKGFMYKKIFNKGSVCPIIVTGTPEQIAFAWNVGVGNSTGIGFGALI